MHKNSARNGQKCPKQISADYESLVGDFERMLPMLAADPKYRGNFVAISVGGTIVDSDSNEMNLLNRVKGRGTLIRQVSLPGDYTLALDIIDE